MLPFERSRNKNNFDYCFGCATQNEALDMITIDSNFFLSKFHQRCELQKNPKIDVSFFVVIHNILE